MRRSSKVHQSLSEFSGGDQMMWRTSRMMRMKAQICLGPKDVNIRTKEQGNTCGLLYCEDRSTGTALKQCHIKFQGVSPLVPVQFSWNKETIITMTLMGRGHSPNG